jgi:hypothetical protein
VDGPEAAQDGQLGRAVPLLDDAPTGQAQEREALDVDLQAGGRDAEVLAAMPALQPVAQGGAIALDDEVLDGQAGIGEGLPQRLVEVAQALEALQAGGLGVEDDRGVVGREEAGAILALVEAREGRGGQRPNVVVAHRRYMSWPPLTAHTWPVM